MLQASAQLDMLQMVSMRQWRIVCWPFCARGSMGQLVQQLNFGYAGWLTDCPACSDNVAMNCGRRSVAQPMARCTIYREEYKCNKKNKKRTKQTRINSMNLAYKLPHTSHMSTFTYVYVLHKLQVQPGAM